MTNKKVSSETVGGSGRRFILSRRPAAGEGQTKKLLFKPSKKKTAPAKLVHKPKGGNKLGAGDSCRSSDSRKTCSGRDAATGRFRKGASGNPRGRPRKKLETPDEIVARSLLEPILDYMSNGRKKKISGYDAVLKGTLKRAIEGDTRAASQVFSAVKGISSYMREKATETDRPLTSTDAEIVEYFIQGVLSGELQSAKEARQ